MIFFKTYKIKKAVAEYIKKNALEGVEIIRIDTFTMEKLLEGRYCVYVKLYLPKNLRVGILNWTNGYIILNKNYEVIRDEIVNSWKKDIDTEEIKKLTRIWETK